MSMFLFSLVFLSSTICNLCFPLGDPIFPGLLSGNHATAPVDMSLLEYGPGYSTYGHQQMRIAQERGIKPVVDTVKSENEKYGNDGGANRAASVAFVSFSEALSAAATNNLKTTRKDPIAVLQVFSPFLTRFGSQLAGLA